MSKNKKKILIVEDETPLLRALEMKFSAENFVVLTARDGNEGLEKAKEFHPDIILLDIVMPVMDGLTMLSLLRQDEWGKGASIIILTNLSEAEKIGESTKHDVFDFLVKSDWNINDVVKKVKDKLGV